jgi:hypothetical protein
MAAHTVNPHSQSDDVTTVSGTTNKQQYVFAYPVQLARQLPQDAAHSAAVSCLPQLPWPVPALACTHPLSCPASSSPSHKHRTASCNFEPTAPPAPVAAAAAISAVSAASQHEQLCCPRKGWQACSHLCAACSCWHLQVLCHSWLVDCIAAHSHANQIRT